jgi:predicted GIY-YIG superfamily endonuclease
MICQRSGKLLESYKSTADAARSVGATPSCIWSVVSGTGFSCKGFYWRRQGSNKLPPPDPTNRAKPIEQVSLATGEVLECFESIYQALKSLGVSSNSGGINGVLNKRQKSAHGYYWRPKGSNAQPQAGAKPHTAPVAARRDANPIYCYLLRSANLEHPQKTYIGITKDPLHRLDQHNGHKRRGAKKTRIGRPWEIVMVIQGFKSRTTALRFEYAWQRFDRSLKVRGAIGDAQAKKLKRQRGIQGQLCMLKTILTECSSSVLEDRALTLNFLDEEFLAKFDGIEPKFSGQELPDNVELKTVDSVEQIVEALKMDDDALEE